MEFRFGIHNIYSNFPHWSVSVFNSDNSICYARDVGWKLSCLFKFELNVQKAKSQNPDQIPHGFGNLFFGHFAHIETVRTGLTNRRI